mmetsp:Transcript_38606/g.120134  ORF Transcript_38606/g.120134 Transcript_38606/m.120134 type:complete len:307 (-) Transcript_38606:513-1433(-)
MSVPVAMAVPVLVARAPALGGGLAPALQLAPRGVLVEAVALLRGVELSDDLDLEGGVADAHALGRLDAALQDLRAAVHVVDHDVRRAADLPGAHRPHVEVVDGVHVGDGLELLHEHGLIDVLRRPRHQGVQSAGGGALGSEEHEYAEHHRAAGVGVAPPADAVGCEANVERLQPDAEGGQAHAQGLHQVADDVRDGRLHRRARLFLPMAVAVVVAVAVAQHLHKHEVHEEAHARDREHDGGVDLFRVEEAVDGLVQQHGGEAPDHHDGEQRPKHLRLREPEGELRRRLDVRQLERHERDGEAPHVR